MSDLHKKAATIIFPRLGSNMPPPVRVSEDIERFRKLHERYHFGGLVLFNGDKHDTPDILAELQTISPLLVASDIERGAGQQMAGGTLFPHALACAKAGSVAVATFARITALEALACGIHIAFTPVADVNSNPRNPIIGIRAFGGTSGTVSDAVHTFISAASAQGLLTTAKHFPGHGDTETDSHAELPIVARDLESYRKLEQPPFETAIATGTDLIMTAHIVYPAFDPLERAATISPPILQNLLRNDLGFTGAVISDSLIMKAIQPAAGEMAHFAANLINAGLDILLDPIDPEAMVEAVVQAVQDGIVSRERLDDAIARVRMLKNKLTDRFGSSFFAAGGRHGDIDQVGCKEHTDAAQAIAHSAIQALRGTPFSCTPDNAANKLAVFVTPYTTRLDPTHAPIRQHLLDQCSSLNYASVDAGTSDARLKEIQQLAQRCDETMVMVVSKPAAWHDYGLPDRLSSFVKDITETTRTTLVSFGDMHILEAYPDAASTLCTFSDVPASQFALADFLA